MVSTVVTIVLWTLLFSLSLLSLLSERLIVCLGHFFCLHSFIVLCVDTLLFPVVYCPMCRTIAWTCISSVACTPWYCSSLSCSARHSITALTCLTPAASITLTSLTPCEYHPIYLCCSSPRALRFFLGNICSFAPARWTLIGYEHFSFSLLSNSTFLSWVEQFAFTPLIYRTGPASLAF